MEYGSYSVDGSDVCYPDNGQWAYYFVASGVLRFDPDFETFGLDVESEYYDTYGPSEIVVDRYSIVSSNYVSSYCSSHPIDETHSIQAAPGSRSARILLEYPVAPPQLPGFGFPQGSNFHLDVSSELMLKQGSREPQVLPALPGSLSSVDDNSSPLQFLVLPREMEKAFKRGYLRRGISWPIRNRDSYYDIFYDNHSVMDLAVVFGDKVTWFPPMPIPEESAEAVASADICVADPSGPGAMDDAMRLAALFASGNAGASERAGGETLTGAGLRQIGAELIDEMRASLERGFRTLITSMSNDQIIERAQRLNGMLFQDDIGPREKSAIAETLLEMHKEMGKRISQDKVGLPEMEGVEWQSDDPTAGIVENIPPFGMVDWWGGFILPISEEGPISTREGRGQPPVERVEFPDELVEVPPDGSDDELIRRAIDALGKSRSMVKGRAMCFLKKLEKHGVDDRYVQVNAYLWINQPPAVYCGDPGMYTRRIRPDLIKALRRAKDENQIVSEVERILHIAHTTFKEASLIESRANVDMGRSALNMAEEKLRSWVAAQQRDNNSIYSCWTF